MARKANAALAAVWRERLGRWKRSKLSIVAFCRQEHVSPPAFFHWRRRLAALDPAQEPRRFVQLRPAAWPAGGVQLTLPSGAVVTLPAQAPAELVMAAIRAALVIPQESPRC